MTHRKGEGIREWNERWKGKKWPQTLGGRGKGGGRSWKLGKKREVGRAKDGVEKSSLWKVGKNKNKFIYHWKLANS
jgi:hypothetical protein